MEGDEQKTHGRLIALRKAVRATGAAMMYGEMMEVGGGCMVGMRWVSGRVMIENESAKAGGQYAGEAGRQAGLERARQGSAMNGKVWLGAATERKAS